MKFLIIHNEYSRRGGEESVVATQRAILERHGHSVSLFTRRHGDVSKFRSFFTAIHNPKVVKELRKVLAAEKPDAAIVHNMFPVISASVLPVLKEAGVRTIMTLHNYRIICPNGLLFTPQGELCERCGTGSLYNCVWQKCQGSYMGSYAWAMRNSFANSGHYYKSVDKFMVLSGFQRDKIVKYMKAPWCDRTQLAERFEVVPNCIVENSMPEPTSQIRSLDYIGFAGRLSFEKGIDTLFKTAELLPHIRFKVAGQTSDGYKLPAIPKNVELVGMLDKRQLADFYHNAQAIILTSRCYEGFPLSVIEAMYYGTSVIIPDRGALAEIVDNGLCGTLFEPDNAADLAAKISEKRDTGENGRQKVIKTYGEEQYYNGIMRCM